MEKKRCSWVPLDNAQYVMYHDQEWGMPVKDDQRLFEFLVLESFQAGLSWEIILKKREAFRLAFDSFDVIKVSHYSDEKITELMSNPNIVRNQKKIMATIQNASIFQNIQKEYQTFANYIWSFTNGKVIYECDKTHSELSDIISKDLQKRGMKFVGTTIIYSYLQAIGIIYSHEENCFLYHKKMS